MSGTGRKAIQVGGALGGIFPPGVLEEGSGSEGELSVESAQQPVKALGEEDCVVQVAREGIASLTAQSGSVCPRCTLALREVEELLTRVVEGEADGETLDRLQAAAERLRSDGHCEAARRAAVPLLTSLRFFRSEYALHVENRHCPARACRKLIPAPCQLACPAGIDIPTYLALLGQGNYGEALEVIREDNPFAWVCGLICPHPCEKACVRARLDQPVNIRYLKAFVAEHTTRGEGYPLPVPAPPTGRKVAVIGSGPAGIAAAHYLALKGHAVTVFEALPEAGGLLRYGIPAYRLPRAIIRQEIDAIRSMGVTIRTGVRVGQDVTLNALRDEGFEAFFLGLGAHQGFKLGIEGEDAFPQVYDAISFLKQGNLGPRQKPADQVVVVGGGNSAMDAARTCLRLGCREVHVAYRRTRAQMPANPIEIEEAMEEGVQFHFLAVPVRVVGRNGQVEALECLRAELGQPDASGRRRPVPVEGSNFRIEAGAIIAAIGQQPDFSCFSDEIPFQITPRNLIVTQPFGTRTDVEDIFAGGDAVTGPATVVEAIAAGKQAALDIDRYLARSREPEAPFHVHKHRRVPFTPIPADEKIANQRTPVPTVDPQERRTNFEPVELSLSEALAQKEARRCLRCDVCIRCGACSRTCSESMQVGALDFSDIGATERILTDYERPGQRCITCGACALVCPTGAMEFVETQTHREVRLCGTVLNVLEAQACARCGAPVAPERTLAHVASRSDTSEGKAVERELCPHCARMRRAEQFVKL